MTTSTDTTGKVTAARLRRDAYLCIRQSTLCQVASNTESTARQYDLRGRAVALGWSADRIHVIDVDQGHSGAPAADREGFQQRGRRAPALLHLTGVDWPRGQAS